MNRDPLSRTTGAPPPAGAGGARPVFTRERLGWIGLVLGPLLAVAAWLWLPGVERDAAGNVVAGLTPSGRATAGMAAWMACWWLTEAVPLAATALLPIGLFPLLGIAGVEQASAPYSRSLIFLFLGGFILGLAMQRWELHRRVALVTLLAVGTRPARLVGGFMLATALLSMWISNTATTVMMLPVGASILELFRRRTDAARAEDTKNFGTALRLGIAYAASIGGIGTLIGSPPNLVFAAFLRERYGIDVSMLDWMRVGLPIVAVMLPLAWLYLTRLAFPVRIPAISGGRALIAGELKKLSPMSRGERTVLVVFLVTAGCWILRPQIARWTGIAGLSDAGIAVAAALLLFVLPVEPKTRTFAMDWDTAVKLPWGILILFGGGLSLADAIARTGVDGFIGSAFLGLHGAGTVLITLAVAAVVIFLTEVTSNTAVATTLMPVLAATAAATGAQPVPLLLAATLAASCAFMLPVATPPNAIVFSSGFITGPQMATAGFGLNLLGILLVSAAVLLLH